MSDTVKLIIEIPEEVYEFTKSARTARFLSAEYYVKLILNGIPLDSNDSDRAEVQAYFAGQTYGWEEGRKDLCYKISEEIKDRIAVYDSWTTQRECTATEASTMREALALVEKYERTANDTV